MTPLEILALFVAVLSVFDAFTGLVMPQKWWQWWPDSIEKALKSKSRWAIPVFILLFALVFGYFVVQQVSILAIVSGIFIGALLSKMSMTARDPKEILPILKDMSKNIDWLTVAIDLALALIVFAAVFLR